MEKNDKYFLLLLVRILAKTETFSNLIIKSTAGVLLLILLRIQRLLGAVQKNATRGDPRSVVKAIDYFCRNTEWAMNVGDEKGTVAHYMTVSTSEIKN